MQLCEEFYYLILEVFTVNHDYKIIILIIAAVCQQAFGSICEESAAV